MSCWLRPDRLADRHAPDTFHAIAMYAKGRLLAMRSDPRAGAAVLRCSLAELKATGYQLLVVSFAVAASAGAWWRCFKNLG
jgi:hypothetical protein